MRKPRTVHVQKTLDKIKRDNISAHADIEYGLLLEQLSILIDISDRHEDEVSSLNEIIGELETSRRLLEEKFGQHLETSTSTNSKIDEIHDRLMNPDNGLVVEHRDVKRRLGELEEHNQDVNQNEKEKIQETKLEVQEEAKIKREKRWNIIYIVTMSLMVLGVFGKQVAIPIIKALIAVLL